MPNRYSVMSTTEKLPCEHPNNEENTITLGSLRKCITCRKTFEWIPPKKTEGYWKEHHKYAKAKESEDVSETPKSNEEQPTSETVNIAG